MNPKKSVTAKKKFLVIGIGVFETEATDKLKVIKPAVLKVVRAKGKSETYRLPIFTFGFSRSSSAVRVGRSLIKSLVDADEKIPSGE